MKRPIDTWLRIQGLKQTKPRKPVLYWTVWFGNTLVDQNNSLPLLRYNWKGQNVIFKSVR